MYSVIVASRACQCTTPCVSFPGSVVHEVACKGVNFQQINIKLVAPLTQRIFCSLERRSTPHWITDDEDLRSFEAIV